MPQEKQAVFQELAAADADPSDVVQDAFLAHQFPGHALGRPVGGTRESVEPREQDSDHQHAQKDGEEL